MTFKELYGVFKEKHWQHFAFIWEGVISREANDP
jgi:hypothetical protein